MLITKMNNINVAISFINHNASVCVLKNGKIELFFQAERVTREKNGCFLDISNFEPILKITNHINNLIFVSAYEEIGKAITDFFISNKINVDNVIHSNEHHIFHAISGFCMSGFSEASVLVVDGWGQGFDIDGHIICETTSFYNIRLEENKIKCTNLFKQFFYNPLFNKSKTDVLTVEKTKKELTKKFNCPIKVSLHFDIGFIYDIFTNHLGFKFLEEGKTMGLSNYGRFNSQLDNIFKWNKDGEFTSNSELFVFFPRRGLNLNKFKQFKLNNFQDKANISYALQRTFEKEFNIKLKKISSISKSKNIVIAGGCALNVINNTIVKNNFSNYNIFVDPIANDASISIGACFLYDTLNFVPEEIKSISWGPKYTKEDIFNSINEYLKNETCTSN